MIDEFIIYITQNSTQLTSQIRPSIFETNPFLYNKEPTFIEYASFYGSIKIINYLKINGVELTSSIWPYSIHSNNSELINLLEENNVQLTIKLYEKIIKESIKCHHNDFANYLINNFQIVNENINELQDKIDIENNENFIKSVVHHFNFEHFPSNINNKIFFYYLCENGYMTLVNLYLKEKEQEINGQNIFNKNIFKIVFTNT